MRVRALVVMLLAAAAFLALYAVGQAGEDDGDSPEIVAPTAIEEDMGETAGPPKLDAGSPLPALKPARRRAAAPAAPAPVPSPSTPAPAPSAPAPAAPVPAPAPQPSPAPAPAPAPPRDPGQPFYDDG